MGCACWRGEGRFEGEEGSGGGGGGGRDVVEETAEEGA